MCKRVQELKKFPVPVFETVTLPFKNQEKRVGVGLFSNPSLGGVTLPFKNQEKRVGVGLFSNPSF
jgi:hypothetical protein